MNIIKELYTNFSPCCFQFSIAPCFECFNSGLCHVLATLKLRERVRERDLLKLTEAKRENDSAREWYCQSRHAFSWALTPGEGERNISRHKSVCVHVSRCVEVFRILVLSECSCLTGERMSYLTTWERLCMCVSVLVMYKKGSLTSLLLSVNVHESPPGSDWSVDCSGQCPQSPVLDI